MREPDAMKGTVIFAGNHQNSFMDPLAVVYTQPRITYFLTRADVFSNRVARFFLDLLAMLPVYRSERNGFRSVTKNEETFAVCRKYLLEASHPIGIYPEANHNLKRSLRKLYPGVARLAFSTLDLNPNLDLRIVPTGVNYSNHTSFRGDLLVIYGKSIKVQDYYSTYLRDENEGIQALLDILRVRMSDVIIDIPGQNNYDETHEKWLESRSDESNLYTDFKRDKELIFNILNEKRIVREKSKRAEPSWLYWLSLPVLIFAKINNTLSRYLVNKILAKLVQDPAFTAAVKFVLGIFLVPIIFFLQAIFVGLIFGSWNLGLIYFFSIPLLNLWYFKVYVKTPYV
ncbi:MAG TPA: hypothetical protein DDX92_02550 [Flavobacteriales bacterium]|jgi:1-acyl-sn-glycerol-3-phosphate acyltransferase|nr:hypothetical protein [Flavobacteriales bacterium]